ncbi:sensor histidine kinase [Solimonas soli]|uniref:sensor histidine kinase n=1 Tax=Solimonas soli TaxID=413479 RepID=UPI000486BC85|nr:ATP-binding protein [Solimonas soli]
MPAEPRVQLPPSRILSLALLLAALTVALCVVLAYQRPYLGLQLQAGDDGLPRVDAAHGPAAKAVRVGEAVLGLRNADAALALRADDLAIEPDVSFAAYADFNAFMARQQQLATLLAQPSLQLLLADGRIVALAPAAHRPVARLPFEFWLQMFAATGCWLLGAAIWAFRREQPAALYLMISGLAVLVMAGSAAIYTTRELALPAALFRGLSQANHGGALLCTASFIAVLFYYPRRLGSDLWGGLLLALYALIWLADALQVLPLANRGVQGSILTGVIVAGGLATLQWRATRGDPLRRAALQWFLLSWFVGAFGFMIVVLIPALAGIDSGELQAYGFGMMLMISLGLALGIARYRLFDLETWWFRAVALVVGGASVIGADLLFVSLLDLGQPAALALALGIAGWIYFPLRQWLASKFFQRFGVLRMENIPALLREVIADAPLAAEYLLPESLRRLFAPLQLKSLETSPAAVCISGNGSALQVPGIGRWPAWEARWAQNGNRLFNRQDVKLADAVRAVLERVVAYQDAVEQSVEHERDRVAADLHDDVGARLLTLLHRAEPEQAQAIRETLASLRLIVHGLGAQPQPLAEALAEWRAELHDRCEAARVAVRWEEAEPLPCWRLDASQQLHLARVLREAVSNALRHAHPTRIEVRLAAADDALLLSIANDGSCRPLSQWRSGNGLRSMRSRTQKLGGELHIEAADGRAVLRLRVPLDAPCPPIQG